MGRLFSLLACVAAMMLVATPAKADWYEASSDHFVIYADDSEKDIRRFSENLERYHKAMEFLTGREVAKPSPSSRVVIFAVGNGNQLRQLAGDRRSTIAGFYIPRAGASRAFVQDIRNRSGYPHFTTVVLLHEYAHHFLISGSRYAMPRWVQEGAAEFFAATSFDKNGGVLIGRPAEHRAYELAMRDPPTARELIDADLFRKNRGTRQEGFYARSWLLYHYLTFSQERIGQLNDYIKAVASGMPSPEAAEAIFGDLDVLEKELEAYSKARTMLTFTIAPDRFDLGNITLRKLPKGEAQMMEVRMVSQRGVNREEAEELVQEARKIAAAYPDDPGVLSALAEAEYDAGNDDAAIAAADRAIVLDPSRANPYVQKGYALFRKAAEADDKVAAYKDAMAPFAALNARENDHPLPLIYYFRSYAERGLEPPESAKLALERAAQLAPFDQRLWFQVAMVQAEEGKIELAKSSLQPLAADPHGGSAAESAKRMIEMLEQVPDGEAFAMSAHVFGGDDGGDAAGGDADESTAD